MTHRCVTWRNVSYSIMTLFWFVCLFVCLGLKSLLNIWGHIATVPACSSGTLTNVLPHRHVMSCVYGMTSVTVYRHRADLPLCYRVMWNVTLEYTTTHLNVLGQSRLGNHSSTSHTHQRTPNSMMLLWWKSVGSSIESTEPRYFGIYVFSWCIKTQTIRIWACKSLPGTGLYHILYNRGEWGCLGYGAQWDTAILSNL